MCRKLLSVLLVICMVLSMVPMAMAAETKNVFTDVAETDWFADEVLWAYGQGLVKGTSETAFSPNMNITRGMVVTILHRYEKEPKVEGTQFADVNRTMYYAMPILWASANGIVTGYDKTSFGPDDEITREQMAAILYRYAKYKKQDVTVSKDASLKAFTDAAKVSSYAEEAMLWAVDAKLINGMTDTTLEPQGNATRAQVATLLYRLFNPPHTHAYGAWITDKDGKTHTKTCANTDGKCDKLTTSENCVYLESTDKCDVCEFADGKVHITTAEQLTAFAAKVNGDEKTPGDNYAGKTVQLEADIDLTDVEWTPIGQDVAFAGTFDGQNHTISNLTAGGSDETGEAVEYVGLFGNVNGTIKNIVLDGATITGNHWVGGIAGYAYGEISGCTVKNATITAAPNRLENNQGYDNGDKVGGIVGYLASEPVGIISKCAVENVTMSAYRDVGGVAGMVNTGEGAEASVTENTVTNVKIAVDQSRFYGYKTPNAGAVVGRIDNEDIGVTVAKNTATNITVTINATTADNKPVVADLNGTAYSDVAAALKIAAKTSNAVLTILADGSYTMPDSFLTGVTINCRTDGVTFSIPRASDALYRFSANGFTLRNASINTDVTLEGSGIFENVDFLGKNSMTKAELNGESAFINCTFPASDMHAFQADSVAGDVTFTNCDLTGMVSYSGWAENGVTFNECVFKNNGPYGELAANVPTILNKCDISDIEVDYTTALFRVDGKYIVTNEDQLRTAAAVPEAVLELQIVLEEDEEALKLEKGISMAKNVTVNGNGSIIDASGCQISSYGGSINDLSIVGDHNGLQVNLADADSGVDTVSDADAGADEEKEEITGLTLKGVSIDEGSYAIVVANGNGEKLTAEDSKFYGYSSYVGLGAAAFTGCTFGQGKSDNEGYLLMGNNTTFENCAFEKGFKLGAAGGSMTINLTECTYDGVKITADNFAKFMVKLLKDDAGAENLKACTITVDGVAVGASSYT